MVDAPIRELTLTAEKPRLYYPCLNDTSLGAALKTERLDRRLTQTEVAVMLNMVDSEYMRFERNVKVPGISKGKRKLINEFLGYNFWDDGSGSIANEILKYRIEHKLTSMELAEQIGVSKNSINRAMNEERISNKMKSNIGIKLSYLKN